MRDFDAARTAEFFNTTYSTLDSVNAFKPEKRLHERDKILVRYIMDPRKSNAGTLKVIDFGCGQGRLVAHLIGQGFDAIGFEKNEGMRSVADAELGAIGAKGRIFAGGVEELATLPAASYDIVLMMGVFQYLSDAEYNLVLNAIKRVLRPGGCLAVTFQNAFFDLFTFNKYTIDFIMHELLGSHLDAAQRATIESDLAALIANPDKPPFSPHRARDNVFVRLTNPLTVEAELSKFDLRLKDKYFYDFHGLPPLLDAKHGEASKAISNQFQIDRAKSWQGHFMAGAFLAEFTKVVEAGWCHNKVGGD
jgi:SAM-dependent methyltransferase